MLTHQDFDYHRERAQKEMDLAYRSDQQVVVEAHMKLAALHMDRMKQEDESCGGSSLRGSPRR
jgi:hypothetical protein